MLNKFYIRHNNDENFKFDSDDDYIKWYDKLFKMIIHLIRAGYIIEIQNDLKNAKSKNDKLKNIKDLNIFTCLNTNIKIIVTLKYC